MPALPPEDYDDVSEKRNSLSFVIINPSCDLRLEEGDIVYVPLCINVFSQLISVVLSFWSIPSPYICVLCLFGALHALLRKQSFINVLTLSHFVLKTLS